MKRFFVTAIIVFLMTTAAICAPVYKYEKKSQITDTVTLTQVEEFHFDHNMSYSYITVDLTDEKISLELLKSDKGIDVMDTMAGIVESDERVVAAVNGDFFSSYGKGYGFSLGAEYKNGTFIQSPIYPETMATTLYDGESVYFDYIDFEITVSDLDGNTEKIRHLNKHTDYYGDILMFTSVFNGGFSPAPGGDVVEVVVEDGIVAEFRRGMESVEIPENGYVLSVSEGNSMFFANNFEVGDEIFVEYDSNVDFDNILTAFGGGSMLVFEGKDVGKIGDYAHTVAGLHPRTALGVDESGTKLTLLTVDGRQTMSRGTRMSHLAELLIDLGCYNAVNLDGGGSTRMLASSLWSDFPEVVNNPTENRKVINAVGVVFDRNGIFKNDSFADVSSDDSNTEDIEENDDFEPAEELLEEETEIIETEKENIPEPFGIKLKSDVVTIFKGEKTEIDIAVYDEYMQRVEYDEDALEWYCDKGSIEDGTFYADCGGKVTVWATLYDLYGDIEIYVVDSIDGIETDSRVVLNVGDKYLPKVSVFDCNGKYLEVDDLSYFDMVSSDSEIVDVSEGTIVAKADGTASVCISKNGVKSFISVTVGTKKIDFTDSFEKEYGSSYVYPEDVKGEFSYTDEKANSGKFSGVFNFDFTVEYEEDVINEDEEIISIDETQLADDISKAVYYVLDEEVMLDALCDKIYISAFAENDFNHRLRVQLEDGKGKMKLIDFEGEIKNGEWTQLCATVGKNIPRPVSVKRVYVLYSPGEEQDMGKIYVDDLSFTSFEPFSFADTQNNVYRNNLCNNNVKHTFRIGADAFCETVTPTSSYFENSIRNKVKRADNFFVLSDANEYGVFEDDYAFYISLDTRKGGIRKTDNTQWKKIVDIVSKTDKENIFLLCNNEIFSEDEFENRVIVDYLSSVNKNVFVISRADSASYKNISGVKFFTLDCSLYMTMAVSKKTKQNCVEFRFGDRVTFEFVNT